MSESLCCCCCCSRRACGLVCGCCGLIYSRQACGLVGTVGLFSTSLWASRYIVRRLLGYYMSCAVELTLHYFFLGNFEFSNGKKSPFNHVVLSIIGQMTRFSSVSLSSRTSVRCFENSKNNIEGNPVLVAVKTHVAAPSSTNSQGRTAKPVRKELPVFFACTEPVGADLGVLYVECGGQTWPQTMLTYTNIHTNTHTKKQRKLFKALVCDPNIIKRLFSLELGKPRKNTHKQTNGHTQKQRKLFKAPYTPHPPVCGPT